MKWYHSFIQFILFIRDQRIKTKPHEWYKGVLLLLLGWGLIGIDSVIFKGSFSGAETKLNFAIQFISALLFLVFLRMGYTFLKKKRVDVYEFFKISKKNQVSNTSTISLKQRSRLIYARGLIGAGGYIGFQLSKIAVGTVDNSIIYGADGLMYALLAMIFLKERYNSREWIGILMAFVGISILLRFDFTADNRAQAILGGLQGILSSVSLAIILIFTTVIVKNDHPVRVAFYQCLCGLVISFFVLAFAEKDLFNINFSSLNIRNAIVEGILYGGALMCFFQAFYYVDPIIVAISSYSLDMYIIILSAINHEVISSRNAISLSLLSIGSAILIREDYKKEKHDR